MAWCKCPIALHDVVGDPPDERQVLIGACLVRGQVWAALRHAFERFVGQRERMPVRVVEDDGVEGSAAEVTGADPD
ncbi:hypothetical protein [Amycolatopsis sp. NPDC059657]|uniref:hypothetical protein n=1 Tax=Amycolatopsis sp. NPDC059657 TaxID=3346899 RepID=UPI003670A342